MSQNRRLYTSTPYRITRLLHWLCAAIFIMMIIATTIMLDRVSNAEERIAVNELHISFGLLFTLILVLRLAWVANFREKRIVFTREWQKRAAHFNYVILYLLMILMPVTGICYAMAAEDPIRFFDIFTIPSPEWMVDLDIKYYSKMSHRYLIYASYVFLVFHFMGALSHHTGRLIEYIRNA